MQRYPDNPRALAVLAKVQSFWGDTAGAARTWHTCLQKDPRFVEATLGLVWIAMRRGAHEEAANLAREALATDPASADAHNLLASVLLDLRKAREAVAVAEDNLKFHPQSPQTHYLIGKAHLQLGNHEEAKGHYETAVQINPGYIHAYYGLGTVCARLGQHEKAKGHFTTFQRLRDAIRNVQLDRLRTEDEGFVRLDVANIYAFAGEVCAAQGDLDGAERLWRKGAALEAKNAECRRALAALCQKRNRPREALTLWQELAEIEPTNVGNFVKLRALHGGLMHFEEAERRAHGYRAGLVGLALAGLVCLGCSRQEGETPPRAGATAPTAAPTPTAAPPASAAGLSPTAPSTCPIQLHDVTPDTRITFQHTDGGCGRRYIVESVSAGLALFDYDGDGLVDIYFPNGAPLPGAKLDNPPRHALYKNLGGCRFRDVTEQAGVACTGYGLGAAAGDYDNDGWPDLYLSNFGPKVLYHNNGNGAFTDVTDRAGAGGMDILESVKADQRITIVEGTGSQAICGVGGGGI